MHFVGAENVHAVLMDPAGTTQSFRLAPWTEVFPAIDALLDRIERGSRTAGAPPEFRAFSRDWGRRLLPPAAALAGFDVLLIIPHHALHGLPFHTIWLEEEQQFLATARGVAYCSSGTLLTRCVDRNKARRSDLARWEVMLDDGENASGPPPPEFCLGMGADVLGDMTDQYRALAHSFAKSFADPLTLPLAVRAGIKNLLGGDKPWQAICVACHGYYDPVLAENCGLLLEQDMGIIVRPIPLHRGKYYDFRDLPFASVPVEPNRPSELMTVSELKVDCLTDAELVALFGCATGAGQVASGGDFDSLAYQWLKIGAPSVLANLWEVGIGFLEAWSPLFLDNWLRKRQPKAIAWREALRTTLERNPGMDPYEWGAIGLFGDWL
jgi:hypothetical protein